MEPSSKYLGLRTIVYHVSNLNDAKAWYSKVLQVGPYFDEPFYVGFDVGGFELGLHPLEDPEMTNSGIGKSIAYWGVPDATAELARLIGLGATIHSDIQEVGVKVAAVLDPFGNIFGIIETHNSPID
jgi:predicted enzyme related to lactoylglutathione lyase